MTKGIICSGPKKLDTCFDLERPQVIYLDLEGPQAIYFDQEDHLDSQRKLRATYSVPAEHHPTYFDQRKLPVIYFDPKRPQAISSDRENPMEDKVEATFSDQEKRQDTYFDRDVLRDTFLGPGVKKKQVKFFISIVHCLFKMLNWKTR